MQKLNVSLSPTIFQDTSSPKASSSHHTITLTRINLPLLRPHIQIDRADQLEEGIIVRLWLAFLQPPVPPHQQTHEDLDLLERKVEANAHPLAGSKAVRLSVSGCFRRSRSIGAGRHLRNVISLAAVLDFVRVPPVRVEEVGVVPDLGVHVNVVERDDDNRALFHFVAAREDAVSLCGSAWLVGGVVAALHFLDEFVQHGEVF